MKTEDGSLHFEADLNTEKLKKSVNASVKQIKGFTDSVVKEAQKIDAAFDITAENIRIQKDVIKGLEQEIGKLSKRAETIAPSNYQNDIRQQIAQLNAELKAEKSALSELETEVKKNDAAQVSFRTQLRNAREELIRMEQAGERGTEAYRKLQLEVGNLQDAYDDATQQARVLANDEKGFKGVIELASGLSGVMSAAQGTVGLFAGENENLQKIMVRVQSLMAITIGLQQVAVTLNKDSYFSLVILANAKNLLAAAEMRLAAAFGISTVAARALMATLTLGLSAAITAIIVTLSKLSSKQSEARKRQEEFNKSVAEAAGDPIAALQRLSAEWNALDGSSQARQKFLRDNAKAFEDLSLAIHNVNDAEKVLSDPITLEKLRSAFIFRAKSMAAVEMAKGIYTEALEKELSLDDPKRQGKIASARKVSTKDKNRIANLYAQGDRLFEMSQAFAQREGEILRQLGLSAELITDGSIQAIEENITRLKNEYKKALTDTDRARLLSDIEREEKKLEGMDRLGSKGTGGKSGNIDAENFESMRLEIQKKYSQAELDLIKSRTDDKKKLIDIELQQEIQAIDEMESIYLEKAKKAGIKNPNNSIFTGLRGIANTRASEGKLAIDAENNKRELNELLDRFQTARQRMLMVEEQYNRDMEALQRELSRATTQEDTLRVEDAIKARTEAMKSETMAIRSNILGEGGEGLIDLYFTGSGSQFIQAKIREAMPLFQNMADMTHGELMKLRGIVGDITFTPEQIEAFRQAGIDIEKLNRALKEAKENAKDAIKEQDWENVIKSARELSSSLGQLGKAFEGIGGTVGEIGRGLSGVSGQISNVVTAFSDKATTTDIISSGISGLSAIIDMVGQQIQENKAAQEDWNKRIAEGRQQMALMRIEAEAYEGAGIFGVENPYAKATAGMNEYTQALEELNNATKNLEGGQVQVGTKKVIDWGNVGIGVGSGAALGAAVGSFIPGIGNLLGAGIGALVGGLVGGIAMQTEKVWQNLKERYGEVLDSSGHINAEILADYDQMDEATKKLIDNWEEIKTKQDEAQELMRQNFSDLAGDLGTSLSDALVEAFANGNLYSAIDKFDQKIEDVIDNIMAKLVFSSVFGELFKDLEAKFNESFSEGGDLTIVDDLRGLSKDVTLSVEAYRRAMEEAGLSMSDFSGQSSSLSGAIQGITEETASILSGYANAIRIGQAESTDIMRNQLAALSQISANTAYNRHLSKLEGILDAVTRIAGQDNLRAIGK